MTDNLINIAINDFVAKDIKHNRICVSGRWDNFTATKNYGIWKEGYPEFDDLMDNFPEEKDLTEIKKHSFEARSSLQNIIKIIGDKQTHPGCMRLRNVLKRQIKARHNLKSKCN